MKHPRHAYSLIEMLLVVLVIAMALLPILTSFNASHQNTRATLEEVLASNLASELIEALQALPYDQVAWFASDVTIDAAGDLHPDPFATARAAHNFPGLAAKTLPGNIRVRLAVEPFPPAATSPALKKIELTVSWGVRGQEIKLTTLKGKI
jgi:type II secretory pathway pseudopilin PulG